MTTRSEDMVAAAKASIEHISVEETKTKLDDSSYIIVDVRDSAELEGGRIPGSVHAHRGGLEFSLDPDSSFRNEALAGGATLIIVCGSGGRAALATKLALDFGHQAICMEGGMKAWIAAGEETE